MKPAVVYYTVAVILVGLIPLVPRMVSLRVRLLHALHLNRLADWHDRNRRVLIPMVRTILLAIAVTLFFIAP